MVSADAVAHVTLRMADDGADSAAGPVHPSGLEVAVEPESVVVTVRETPDLSTVVCLRELLGLLLDRGMQAGKSP
jgi:hypothetical protein